MTHPQIATSVVHGGRVVKVRFHDKQRAADFESFTNDFTVWSAVYYDVTDNGSIWEVAIAPEELGEDGDDIESVEEYADRYLTLLYTKG